MSTSPDTVTLSDCSASESDSGSGELTFKSTLAHSQPRFPIEVCERIINFTAARSICSFRERTLPPHLTLAACCLICRAWLPRSRLRLYHDLELEESHSYRNNISLFIQCLKHSPNNFNGRLVQRLEVSSVIFSDAVGNSGISLIANQLPRLLPNLSSFIVEGANLISVHPTCYASLSRFTSVRYLKLHQIRYSTYDQLFRFIAGFRNLSHLDVAELNCLELLRPSRRTRCSRQLAIPHLLLIIPPPGSFFPDMMDRFSPCMEFIDIYVVPGFRVPELQKEWIRVISGFVQRCGDSLRCLRLTCETEDVRYDNIGNYLDFSHNGAIRSLELVHIPIGGSDDEDRAAEEDQAANESQAVEKEGRTAKEGRAAEEVRSLARAFTTVSSTCLEDLTVILYLSDMEDKLTAAAWRHVDAAFALPAFGRLKHIRVGIKSHNHVFYSFGHVASLLPRLATRPAFILIGPEAYYHSPFYELPWQFSP